MISLLPIWEYVLRAIQHSVKWLVEEFVADNVPDISSEVGDLLPSSNFNFSNVIDSSVFSFLCEIFPVEYAITCFIGYCAIAAIVYLVNWILGAIPTVS